MGCCCGLLQRDGGCVCEGSPAGRDVGGRWSGWGGVSAFWVWCCPRTPRLTSILGPGWFRVADMMCDGVFRQMAVRPLSLSVLVPAAGAVGRQQSRRELAAFIG